MLATESTIPASRMVMNVAYWLRFCSTSRTRSLPAWPREEAGDPGQPAEAREPQQRTQLEDPHRRDRSEQIEPAALADEVAAPRARAHEVDRRNRPGR